MIMIISEGSKIIKHYLGVTFKNDSERKMAKNSPKNQGNPESTLNPIHFLLSWTLDLWRGRETPSNNIDNPPQEVSTPSLLLSSEFTQRRSGRSKRSLLFPPRRRIMFGESLWCERAREGIRPWTHIDSNTHTRIHTNTLVQPKLYFWLQRTKQCLKKEMKNRKNLSIRGSQPWKILDFVNNSVWAKLDPEEFQTVK